MFDTDNSGVIDMEEFRAMAQQIGMNPTKTEMELMMAEVDTDSSGTIDLNEFITVMKRKAQDTEANDVVKATFDMFDVDGSGALSYDELRDVLHHLGEKMSPEEVTRLIEAADTDKSGDVNVKEFMNLCFNRLC